jgi:hypothetical protein
MLVFESFWSGQPLGEARTVFDWKMFDAWCEIFPADRKMAPYLPPGLAVVIMMRAYSRIVSPRPPGNIHASQEFEILSSPQFGDEIITNIKCIGCQIKNEKRWLDFKVENSSQSVSTSIGTMKMIWAK